MARLDHKVAIITGGARGMGAAHSRLFVEEGAKVLITDVLDDEGQALADELGPNAHYQHLDVTSTDEWQAALAATISAFGSPTVLVNNAGIGDTGPMADWSVDRFRTLVDINLTGPWIGMKTIAPAMSEGGGGSIINISSVAGLVGNPDSTAYTASKFGLRGMTKAAAVELAPAGIRVNSVHPGVIRTPMLTAFLDEEMIKAAASPTPLGRAAEPIEVSRMVLYLASDESSFSTGSEFVVDGGWTCT